MVKEHFQEETNHPINLQNAKRLIQYLPKIMQKTYYDRNSYILDNENVNITFHELLMMNDDQITEWIDLLRSEVIIAWDQYGMPPLSGRSEDDMEEIFREMSGTNGITLELYKSKTGGMKPYVDELTGEENVIINNGNLGSCVNQWFPNMMKAKINYNLRGDGISVYDLFKDPKYRNRMQKGCRRHFRRDSFYRYSVSVEKHTNLGIIPADTGKEWVQYFNNSRNTTFKEYGFWLSRVETAKDKKGTGYTQVDANKFLKLSKAEILELYPNGVIRYNNLTNIVHFDRSKGKFSDPDIDQLQVLLKDDEEYHIRFYKKTDRIFPIGFTAFKIGYIQIAVNFPPMIAKYIYEKYTNHIKNQDVINIYDPSSGWGGRIAGAMTVRDDRKIHYIGTDPNTDNYLKDFGITKYEAVAEFINKSLDRFGYDPHTYEIFQLGSEVIGENKDFQKYKGKLDLVFTSPPYFSKESYSEDPTQSCKKFTQYDEWRDKFLRPTLETAVSYLKNNRYLLWNIADVFYGKTQLPLEKDSKEILESLGMEYKHVIRMTLTNMPGQNRMDEDGNPKCKNFVKVNSKFNKYEPVFVFWKP
jgi:hypothetical protein